MDTQPSAVTTTAKGKPRKRVSEACVFCRKRKIRCNNEQPQCANCKAYSHDCVYEPYGQSTRQKRQATKFSDTTGRQSAANSATPRSSTRPSSADDENGDNLPAGEIDISLSRNTSPSKTPVVPTSLSKDTPPVSRIIFSDNGASSYHGQTSALFEENSNDRRRSKKEVVPTEWVEKALIAEASLQRQMEMINFRNNKLDFDGVEPELGMHLLNLHWNRQHHSFLITYRPAFMRDMACNGPYFSKILLNAIYYGSSKFSTRSELRKDPSDVTTAGWKFRQRVRELLGNALDGSDITTIQALLVMANSLFALGDERSAAWLYSGLAFRMIIDLGIHAEAAALSSARKLSHEDHEIRRRVFWGAFVVDKIMSLYQGRPVSLQEADSSVPITFRDKFEENENWTPFAYASDSNHTDQIGCPAYSVSTFTALCELSRIMNQILNSIYAERIFDRASGDLSQLLDDLHTKMESWNQSLAPHLQCDSLGDQSVTPPPHVLSLAAMYNVLLILLHRPFVADGHLHNTARSISVNSLLTCATAATQMVRVLRLYDKAFSVRRAPYLISYATYVSATIHVRIAAKRNSSSDAHKSLRTCLAVLTINQETNAAARRAKAIVEGLMKRLKVEVPDLTTNPQIHIGGLEQQGQPTITKDTPSRGAAVTEQLHPDGFSPGLDIDAVIQSFVPAGESNPHLLVSSQFGTQFVADNVNRPIDYGQQPGTYVANSMFSENPTPGNGGWYDQINEQSFPFDDLLFGFNGSMLDDYSTATYPG